MGLDKDSFRGDLSNLSLSFPVNLFLGDSLKDLSYLSKGFIENNNLR